jgi:hypothetical protein
MNPEILDHTLFYNKLTSIPRSKCIDFQSEENYLNASIANSINIDHFDLIEMFEKNKNTYIWVRNKHFKKFNSL